METTVEQFVPEPHPFDVMIEAIAEAVVRKIEERQRIHALAAAVLGRLRELGAEEGILGGNGNGSGPNGGAAGEADLQRLILEVMAGGDAAPDSR
jgi:hypothetical protein